MLDLDKSCVTVCPENYSKSIVTAVLKCLFMTVQKVKAGIWRGGLEYNLYIYYLKSRRV